MTPPVGASRASMIARQANAIPDSGDLHARYDATQLSLSDGDAVSTWPDETGNGYDLTTGTAPILKTGIINGNPVVRFDGADDLLTASFSSISQPLHIFAVIIDQNADYNNARYLYDGEGSINAVSCRATNSGEHAIFAGSNLEVSNTSGALITAALYDSANSSLRVNGGAKSVSGDVGTNALENGLRLGARADNSNYGAWDVGELLVYPVDKSSVESDVEAYLNDKWGVY